MIGLKAHRWNHIFAPDGKTVIVAMDHAGAYGAVSGLERPGETLCQVRAGGADAVLTTFGIAKRFAQELGDLGLVLRVDGGTSMMAKTHGAMQLTFDVYDALRVGADAVGCMGMRGSQTEADTLPYLADLVAQCTEWNVPVLAEMLPGGFEDPREWWTPENMASACRLGAEYGVDFIKTAYTGSIESFRKVIEQLYVPVVVLGGGKSNDPRELLQGLHGAMQAGACGVAVGRNIYQYSAPDKMTAAIVAIVHGGATVEAALEVLK